MANGIVRLSSIKADAKLSVSMLSMCIDHPRASRRAHIVVRSNSNIPLLHKIIQPSIGIIKKRIFYLNAI